MELQNTSDNDSSTLEPSNTIQPINRNTVHRICSGQVVLSLAIAVKELVENAIDAKAKHIQVRLIDYGKELIEVSDNGVGVRSENFQALTLKHYTSKIKEFTDLESVCTLGFRGEALSSLCALSDLSITTQHTSAEHATKLCYDNAGNITSQAPAAREIGTTVTLENLFAPLPVRRKEFTKNLKKEYGKMCQLLYAYCLVSKGVKFTCTNQLLNGSRPTVVSTEGSSCVRDNIISIFGVKQVQSLLEVNMHDPDENVLEEYKIKLPNEPLPFNFEFLISSAIHGSGRSTNDRQFFYINDRPCEPNKISKLTNEIYKQFNSHQYPFIYLNIIMEKSFIDVNVTPDKRQIFLEKEKLLLATLKTSLRECFKQCPSTLDISFGDIGEKSAKRRFNSTGNTPPQKTTVLNLDSFKKKQKTDSKPEPKQSSILEFSVTTEKNKEEILEEPLQIPQEELEKPAKKIKIDTVVSELRNQEKPLPNIMLVENENSLPKIQQKLLSDEKLVALNVDNKNKSVKSEMDFSKSKDVDSIIIKTEVLSQKSEDTDLQNLNTNSVTIRSSLNYIKDAIKNSQKKEREEFKINFRSEIAPASNKSAEQELQKQITKDMFKKMEIIGQFNLGFIITKLKDDIFIVDQHATDEKYNFEELQRNTIIESQTLVNPRPLELSAANEELLIDNEAVFRKNGFKFIINNDAPSTKKVKLSAIPISKNYAFGKDDIEEMLFMMQEEVNYSVCRPSRVRSMLASRACRKSVMVGCSLNQSDMKRLIEHMGEIDQPWNCPHGRPTIRHLINLQLIKRN